MTNTTASFASIDTDLLEDVQGGCGRRRRCCRGGCGTKNVSIVNNYAAAAPAAPAAAPAPAPSSNWSVNVSAGYAQA